MSKFKVPPDESLDITLRRKPKPGRTGKRAASEAEQPGVGLIDTDTDPARYVFRGGKGTLQIFDLGMRLTSTPSPLAPDYRLPLGSPAPVRHEGYFNEYVELAISISPASLGAPDTFEGFALSDLHALDDALLGSRGSSSDPGDVLGTTPSNATGAALPNCLLIPDPSPNLFPIGWAAFFLEPPAGDLWITGDQEKDKAFSALTGEHWGPQNLADGTAPFAGHYQLPKRKWAEIISSFDVEFSTADAEHVKLTREPSYSAAEVPAPAKWVSPLKVYRACSLAVVAEVATGRLVGAAQRATPIRPFGDFSRFTSGEGLQTGLVPVWPRKLLAIIVNKGSEEYYVWQRDLSD